MCNQRRSGTERIEAEEAYWLQVSVHKAQAMQMCNCQDNLGSVQASKLLIKDALQAHLLL